MDLAERRKELVPVNEVDNAGRDAIALMKSAFERATEAEAETIAHRNGWDARVLRLALKNFAQIGIDNFHREVLLKLDAIQRAEMYGEDDQSSETSLQ